MPAVQKAAASHNAHAKLCIVDPGLDNMHMAEVFFSENRERIDSAVCCYELSR